MRRALNRLRSMPASEIAGRLTMKAAASVDRWSWHVRRPVWRREALSRALVPSTPALQRAARLLAARDAVAAHRELSSHFASRPSRFVVAPASRNHVAALIQTAFPTAAADARGRAERALAGRLDVLGYPALAFADDRGRIDWVRDPVHDCRPPMRHWTEVPFLDPSVGDHKIIWELNRHQHWLTLGRAYWLTGEARYRDGFVDQLEGWLEANPPHSGINWASMLELAFRSLSWIWALHLFVEDAERSALPREADAEAPWVVDLLLGLRAQMNLVERQLSTYFSPNTHLIGEALALYVTGRVLPELRDAERWSATGRAILLGEIARQILPDGGHAELSTHYHRYTLDFYLFALAIARATSDDQAVGPFEEAAGRLARFAHALADHRLQLPQIGDDDGGVLLPMCTCDARDAGPSLAVAAALLGRPELGDGRPREDVIWLTGRTPAAAGPVPDHRTSAWLPDSGYVVSRTARGDHLVMDVGPLGYRNAGHAHADALSLTLAVEGRPLLIDPGTGCYTIDPALRDRFRTTAAHNTVTLDDRPQSEPASPFHWRSQARAAVHAVRLSPRFDYIEASHDGYGPDGHRRQVLGRAGCWMVIDWIGGRASRKAAAHWHLDAAWHAELLDERRVALRHSSGARLWMVALSGTFERYTADANGLGWHAPVYGAVRPTTTLRLVHAGAPPFALVTAIVESDAEPRLDACDVTVLDRSAASPLAFRLTTSLWSDTVVAAGPQLGDVDGAVLGIEGRGRLICVRRGGAGIADPIVAHGHAAPPVGGYAYRPPPIAAADGRLTASLR